MIKNKRVLWPTFSVHVNQGFIAIMPIRVTDVAMKHPLPKHGQICKPYVGTQSRHCVFCSSTSNACGEVGINFAEACIQTALLSHSLFSSFVTGTFFVQTACCNITVLFLLFANSQSVVHPQT